MKWSVAAAFCQDDDLFFLFLNKHYFALAGLQSSTLPLAQGRWDAVAAILDPAGKRATENLWIAVKLSKATAIQDIWPASRHPIFFFFFVKQTEKRNLNDREPSYPAATVYTAQQLDGFSVRD